MKLSEYLAFAALLTPTLVVALAAAFTILAPVPAPEYHPPVTLAAGAVLYPAGLTTDE